MALKLLQVNLNRLGVATDLMWKTVKEEEIDLVLIQEPNIKRSCDKHYYDISKETVIIVCDTQKIKVREYGPGPGYV